MDINSYLGEGVGDDAEALLLDSLDMVEFLLSLEEEFGIEIPDDDPLVAEIQTKRDEARVRDVVNYLETRLCLE